MPLTRAVLLPEAVRGLRAGHGVALPLPPELRGWLALPLPPEHAHHGALPGDTPGPSLPVPMPPDISARCNECDTILVLALVLAVAVVAVVAVVARGGTGFTACQYDRGQTASTSTHIMLLVCIFFPLFG